MGWNAVDGDADEAHASSPRASQLRGYETSIDGDCLARRVWGGNPTKDRFNSPKGLVIFLLALRYAIDF
jgi:hypothetical protein